MMCASVSSDSPWEGRNEWHGASSPSSSDLFPVRVLGAGSIGLLYSDAMNRAFYHERKPHDAHGGWRNPVTLLVRSHHRSHVLFHRKTACFVAPVTVTGPTEGVVSKYDTPVEFVDEEGGRSPILRLLLCTKANDAVAALESVWDRLISEGCLSSLETPPGNSKVIVLCNGALAVRDAIHEHFGDDVASPGMPSEGRRVGKSRGVQIVLATTTHGAYRTNQSGNEGSARRYAVTHAGVGTTHSTDEEFMQVCQSIGWQAETLSDWDMNMMLWRKLAVNCVINPLTAVHGVKNGQLLGLQHEGQDVKVVTKNIVEEVSRVALLSMEAHVANNQSSNSNDAFLQSAREQLSVPSLEAFVFQVMADTSNNISSMLQDVRAKRTTEVRYLNGYVAALGRDRFGIDCPLNDRMCRLIEGVNT
ncbi:hypothetical protein ACHAXT_005625 [Thalassiosira profunda]